MDFTALTCERYSVRKFQSEPVSREQIDAIIEVAANAPTACNRQPQRIFVVDSPEGKAKIKRSTECHFDAPLFFVICCDGKEAWQRQFDGKSYAMVDGAIVMTQMMLKITELGLGSCFVAWFDPAVLKAELALPENLIPVGILPCGKPATDSVPAPMHNAKKKLEEIVYFC